MRLKKTADIISAIFHPVFMPLVGMYIILNSGIFETSVPAEFRRYIYIFVTLFSVMLPASFVPLLYYWKVVKSIELSERRERFIPLMFTATSLVMLNVLLNHNIPVKLFNAYTFSVAAVAVLLLFINLLLKISLHLTALGGITGLILVLSVAYNANLFLWLVAAVFVSGFVASARLYNKAHTFREVALGYLVGLTVTYSLIFYLAR